MVEQIEIKRKVFEVESVIGEKTKKVNRKGKVFFLKDFGNDAERFNNYIEANHKCKINGVHVPKIILFDKDKHIVISEFIEGKTVLSLLLENDLKDEIFEKVFYINWYVRNAKFSIDFDPANFLWNGENLYYISENYGKFEDKKNLEKTKIFLWFYSSDFVKYLMAKGIQVDTKRANVEPAVINKKVALTVVKFFR